MDAWFRESTPPPGTAALALRATPAGPAAVPGGGVGVPAPAGHPAARSGAGGLRPPRTAPPTPTTI